MKIKRAIKHLWQKIYRGWSDEDTWDLQYTIAKFALPRLKRHKQLINGYPAGLTEQEWYEILDKIIWSFEFLLSDENIEIYPTRSIKELFEKEDEGFRLFGEYYCDLWW